MTTVTRRRARLTYQQVLGAIRQLPAEDQQRLRHELENPGSVLVIRPSANSSTIRRGRRLAKAIQAELAKRQTGSLDDTMRSLRLPA